MNIKVGSSELDTCCVLYGFSYKKLEVGIGLTNSLRVHRSPLAVQDLKLRSRITFARLEAEAWG